MIISAKRFDQDPAFEQILIDLLETIIIRRACHLHHFATDIRRLINMSLSQYRSYMSILGSGIGLDETRKVSQTYRLETHSQDHVNILERKACLGIVGPVLHLVSFASGYGFIFVLGAQCKRHV